MFRFRRTAAVLCAALAVGLAPLAARATIIDDWASVKAPAPPALTAVTIDVPTTALLVLDFVKEICTGPVCTSTVPNVAKLLQTARAKNMLVVYSRIPGSTMADTLPALAPLGSEPAVVSVPDKFINTDLLQTLTSKGIKTVIVTGVLSQGAVIFTGSHAAQAGFNVIVPVDGIASESPFAQQYTVWSFANAPVISAKAKLTTLAQIGF